jgi:hypothetical protein
MGVSSEIALIVTAMPVIRETNLFTYTMPNALNVNFNFFYAQFVIIAAYLPGMLRYSTCSTTILVVDRFECVGFYSLFTYMLTQRKRQLSRKPE